MGLWNRKGKHDREAGSLSRRRRGSVKKEEPASPPRRAPAPPAFSLAPAAAGERDRQYIHVDEIERRSRLLPDDLYCNERYAPDSSLWDTWFQDEHDMRRASFFADTSTGPRRPRPEHRAAAPQVRGRTQEEARLMEDSMRRHDERQWEGLEETMALSAVGDVAIPELEMVVAEEVMEEAPVAAFHPDLVGQHWSWSCSAPEMADAVGCVNWCPTPPRSPEREASPREEVVQAPATFHPAPARHGPPAHLWTPPEYVDLVSDDDDTGGQ
ncbi:hypothetical protein VPH35_012783 [Triticum aestivum]